MSRWVVALAVLCALAVPAWAQQYDLVLYGGHVIDPRNGIDGPRDVAVRDGKIAAIAAQIDRAQARSAVDCRGLYVTPGLVDLHTHVFHTTGIPGAWAGDSSIAPDGFSFRTGVTTMVDAGSSGWRNFETLRHTVIDRVRTRVLALVNIVGLGMINDPIEQDRDDMKPEEVAQIARKHKDVVVGVKSAHYRHPDWTSVDRAIEAGKLAGVPIMVDFGYFLPERPYWKLVTERLRPGDISTHCYRAPVPWVDAQGKLYSVFRQARERGVRFDVGHGGGSFVFRNAAPAVKQGFLPDSISTDLHTGSMNAGLQDMPTTMSKFLAMGMELREVVLRSTWNPAQMISRKELGHLTAGAEADVAVWELREGKFGFVDAAGGRLDGARRLECELTLRGGRIVWDRNGRGAVDDKTLPPTYGIRPGVDTIVPPK